MTTTAPGLGSAARPGPGVITAGPADIEVLSQVITEAFLHLPPSRWLIADPDARRAVFPAYFRILAEHAITVGTVHTTPGRTAAALWLPAAAGPPPGYGQRLAAVAGCWSGRFTAFDATLDATTRPAPPTTTWPCSPSTRTTSTRAPAACCCTPTTPPSTTPPPRPTSKPPPSAPAASTTATATACSPAHRSGSPTAGR